jgi:hypothetical protein
MSQPFHITLVHLKADLSAVDAAADKVELDHLSAKEFFRLAGKLQKLAPPASADCALIVRLGSKGWRIVAHDGQLRVHHGTSAFEDYWTVKDVAGLAELSPFALEAEAEEAEEASGWQSMLGSSLKLAAMLVAGLALMAVSLWFGLPHRKVRAVPPDVVLLTSTQESEKVFTSLAGTYASGRKQGDVVVSIQSDGSVWLGAIGKDGKVIRPPRIEETAKAAMKQDLACVVTSFGIFAAGEPDTVTIGTARWRRAQIN